MNKISAVMTHYFKEFCFVTRAYEPSRYKGLFIYGMKINETLPRKPKVCISHGKQH